MIRWPTVLAAIRRKAWCDPNYTPPLREYRNYWIDTMATNLEAARDIQHGHIDDSAVPGTVHLVDIDNTMHAKHSKAHQDIVLVPTPSDDPDDPVQI